MRSGLERLRYAIGDRSKQSQTPVPFATRVGVQGIMQHYYSQNRTTQLRMMSSIGEMFGIVSLCASSTARVNWCLYRKQTVDGRRRYATGDTGPDERVEVTRHPALDLWNRPNDWFTQRSFVERFSQHLELAGEGAWVIMNPTKSLPLSMWPVRPDRLEPVPDPDNFLSGYIYYGPQGEQIPLETWECIGPPSLAFPNPEDPYHGLSPVASVLTAIRNAQYAGQWSMNYFANNATPGGIIEVPGNWNDGEWDTFVDSWRESHRGVSAAGVVATLENGAKWNNVTQTMHDMQFAELRQVSRNEIRSAWRMHSSMLGLVEDVNRANAETAQEDFARWLVTDRLDRIKDVLNHQYLSLWGAQNVELYEFDYEDPVPDNREADNAELTAKVNAWVAAVGAGADPDSAAEMVGLPSIKMKATAPAPTALPSPDSVPALPAPDPTAEELATITNALRQEEIAKLEDLMSETFRSAMLNGHKKRDGLVSSE